MSETLAQVPEDQGNNEGAEAELHIAGVPESLLPIPVGYKILIKPPEPEETTAGGIIKSAQTLRAEEVGAVVAYVVKLGPEAYKDESKFPTGPRCKEGDFIMIKPYAGARFAVNGAEFRLINDDMVEAIVKDPRVIERV